MKAPARGTHNHPIAILRFAPIVAVFALALLNRHTAVAQSKILGREKADQVIATIQDEPVTREAARLYISRVADLKMAPDRAYEASPDELRPVLEDMAAARAAGREFDESPAGLTERWREITTQTLRNALSAIWFQKTVLDRIEEPTEKELREYYENNEQAYTIPFHFDARYVFVSNYEEVVTKTGDTLEGLAERISGDVDDVPRILINNAAKSPRAPGWDEGRRDDIPPLTPGEELLVPIDDEAREANRVRIRAARRRVERGEDIAGVAEEFSDAMSHGELVEGLGLTGRPLLPEVLEAARETPEGELTEIFESKHGMYFMQVQNKVDAELLDFEDVKSRVHDRVMAHKRNDLARQVISDLYDDPDLSFIRTESEEGEVKVRLGDQVYSQKEAFEADVIGTPSADMDREELVELLRSSGALRDDLILHRARQMGLDDSPAYGALVDATLNRSKMEQLRQARENEMRRRNPSTEDLQDYFERHRSELNAPRWYTYYRLALRIPPRSSVGATIKDPSDHIKGKIESLTRGLESLDDFKAVVSEESSMQADRRTGGLLERVPEWAVPDTLAPQLRAMPKGSLSPPVKAGDYWVVAWLVEQSEPFEATFESVRPWLPGLWKQEQTAEFPRAFRERLLKQADLKIADPED